MAEPTPTPQGQPQPQANWLEEVKRDAEYLYKKRLAEQQADKEYEESKKATKK
jgi:hypothetical protein